MTRRALSFAYIASLIVMVVVGFGYSSLSPGLATRTSSGPFFCNQLMSSGSDDDAMLFAFALFILPLTIRILRAWRRIARVELVVFGLCAFVSCVALWLASLDCASIFYTAFIVPDPALAGALVALLLSTVTLVSLRFVPHS
ncbi:MAG: hypothetical protein AB7U46_16975 [Paenirhodobacter sp.]|uniref:hypothetical protein n=1 Tax=Paenirhodobacter sp. TaxID=1965326 RepID=UPI003D11B944